MPSLAWARWNNQTWENVLICFCVGRDSCFSWCPEDTIKNKTGLQQVSRPVELVHYFGGWEEGPSKQTDRTDGGRLQSTFGVKAE